MPQYLDNPFDWELNLEGMTKMAGSEACSGLTEFDASPWGTLVRVTIQNRLEDLQEKQSELIRITTDDASNELLIVTGQLDVLKRLSRPGLGFLDKVTEATENTLL